MADNGLTTGIRVLPDASRRPRRRSRTSCGPRRAPFGRGGRMLIGIWAFAFAALAFAYFYLRSANNEDLWRPPHITAPTAVGAAIFAFSLAAAAPWCSYGTAAVPQGAETLDWQVAGWTAVLCGLLPSSACRSGSSPNCRSSPARAATPRASSAGPL